MFVTRISRPRKGFSLIELVVIVSIIGVLLALVLVAIQYSRQSARKISCVNNLKQMGTALSTYESAHGVYPQGINGQYYSAHLMVLPFLDQSNLYNSINFNVRAAVASFADGEPNATVGYTRISTFACPSDPDAMKEATTNYAWNGGAGFQAIDFTGSFGMGATKNLRYIKPSDITDGLSTTSAMSEWKLGHRESSDDTTVVFKVSVGPFDPATYSEFVQKCADASRNTTEFGAWKKEAWWVAGIFGSSLYNSNTAPNSHSCLFDLSIDFGNWPASSYHSNGVNVLFHDNHIVFIKNSISLQVWKSISTRAGNEVISLDLY